MRKITEFASKLFLFKGIPDNEIEELISDIDVSVASYSKSEVIYSPNEYEKKIGFVLSGRCEVVCNRTESAHVSLNILEKYDSFGALAAFSRDDFPTEIRAARETEILFFTKEDVLGFIKKSPPVSINIIEFLADRIAFLNGKIATFTCGRSEDKLARFLITESTRYKALTFAFNCQRVASMLNMGRASIYRALDSLSAAGYITYDTKKISITNLDELERTLK